MDRFKLTLSREGLEPYRIHFQYSGDHPANEVLVEEDDIEEAGPHIAAYLACIFEICAPAMIGPSFDDISDPAQHIVFLRAKVDRMEKEHAFLLHAQETKLQERSAGGDLAASLRLSERSNAQLSAFLEAAMREQDHQTHEIARLKRERDRAEARVRELEAASAGVSVSAGPSGAPPMAGETATDEAGAWPPF